jgi:hypothetical protein
MIYTLKKNDKLFVKILLKAEAVSEKRQNVTGKIKIFLQK